MTSKEDLKTLLEYFYYQGKTPIIPKEQVEFILNNLEKDLEVLEILKDVIEDDFGYFKLEDQSICIDTSVYLSKEKYKKMREWLENDK